MAKACGCLILGWGQAELTLIDPLTQALTQSGWIVQVLDASAQGRAVPLDEARDAYVRMVAQYGGACVAGIGAGASVAMLLAEQYDVSALVLVAPEQGNQRKAQGLMRLAVRNLFAVVAPTLVVQPVGDTRMATGVRRIVRGMSSRACHTLWLEGQCPLGLPGTARGNTIHAILEHLCHATDTNSLAN